MYCSRLSPVYAKESDRFLPQSISVFQTQSKRRVVYHVACGRHWCDALVL